VGVLYRDLPIKMYGVLPPCSSDRVVPLLSLKPEGWRTRSGTADEDK
jgi:hypothetical protein